MQVHLNEFQSRPLPRIPQPRQRRVQPPTVYAHEEAGWELPCRQQACRARTDVSEDELNTLGTEGWELVGVVPPSGKVQFYFKRVRT